MFIPDDEEFLAIVNGALLDLTYERNFEQFGDLTPEETAEYFRVMYRRYFEVTTCMIGAIVAFPNDTLPDGMLACDGATYDRNDYPDLYAALHVDYYVSDTQFSVPDMRDRFVVGAGSDYSVGDTGGEDTHTLTIAEMPNHAHYYTPPTFNIDLESPGAPDAFAAGIGVPTLTDNEGGGGAHENRPPYYALVWAIIAR